jgi:hypothetical protein
MKEAGWCSSAPVGSILPCGSGSGEPLVVLERCEYLRFWNQFQTCAQPQSHTDRNKTGPSPLVSPGWKAIKFELLGSFFRDGAGAGAGGKEKLPALAGRGSCRSGRGSW